MKDMVYNEAYQCGLEKNKIPVCNILGVNIAAIDMKWLIEYINNNIKELNGDYICVSNVHTTIMAYENEEYKKVQNGGALAIPDGGPLSTVGRRRGFENMNRTTGPDLMRELFTISVKKGYRHFFLGSTNDTLKKMRSELIIRYPGIQISGMYSPSFGKISEKENSEIIDMINKSKSDFVWVGLGAPKQENWMAEHQGKIKGLMIGVGAGFDYFAGNIKRAPKWMQKCNLEWLYRLMQDPKRLFKRYMNTNMKFIWNVFVRGK